MRRQKGNFDQNPQADVLAWQVSQDEGFWLEIGMPPQGYNAQLANVELVITAFRDGLKQQGYKSR